MSVEVFSGFFIHAKNRLACETLLIQIESSKSKMSFARLRAARRSKLVLRVIKASR